MRRLHFISWKRNDTTRYDILFLHFDAYIPCLGLHSWDGTYQFSILCTTIYWTEASFVDDDFNRTSSSSYLRHGKPSLKLHELYALHISLPTTIGKPRIQVHLGNGTWQDRYGGTYDGWMIVACLTLNSMLRCTGISVTFSCSFVLLGQG